MSDETVGEWITKAEMDYESALDLARRRVRPVPDKVAYDCAQCAEKYLKGFLTRHKHPFRRRHDLVELQVAIKQVRKFVRAKLGVG